MVTKKLKCEECGGIMDINEDKKILFCPYCGSKELIEESDEVKIAKIETELEEKKLLQLYEHKHKVLTIIFIIVLLAFGFIALTGNF